jgi:RNA polymerase sigma-70 factor (ECF subfamily)
LGGDFVLESESKKRNNDQGDLDLIFREVEDRDLVLQARQGRVEAYNALVSRWETRIYNYLLRLTGSPEDAMDLSQDAFLKVYQHLGKLDDVARFGPWLYRIAHNEAMSHLRRQRPEDELQDQAVGPMPGPRMAPVEVTLAVEAALARLSAEQREAVVLKVYEGFKFDEIAQILECPASTIKSRVYTGLELLKEILAPVVRPPLSGE